MNRKLAEQPSKLGSTTAKGKAAESARLVNGKAISHTKNRDGVATVAAAKVIRWGVHLKRRRRPRPSSGGQRNAENAMKWRQIRETCMTE
ncbi:MAG: hypothetical protein IPO66_17435 [Rhodanobacteraceae bacterium]|nr:hypothetical protein [Rhodanobacteraceae bacterium]